MNYWIITDTHFGHHKMQDYCLRPEGFEEIILKNIKSVVNPLDIFIHLGDFCIYKDEQWHKRFMEICPAKKWLIRGNHDRKSLGWYYAHGWDFVADEVVLSVFGKKLILSHCPVVNRDDFDLNIHGHLHDTLHHNEYEITPKHRLLFIEHKYCPVSLRRIVEGK